MSSVISADEAALLAKHLQFYTALAVGRRQPATPAQEHFVQVCQGKAVAQTPHETAFAKYREQCAAQEREAALQRQQEYQKKLDNYYAERNKSLMESDDDRWW